MKSPRTPMPIETLLYRLRWVALVLPIFALISALHVGCVGGGGSDGVDDYGYGYSR